MTAARVDGPAAVDDPEPFLTELSGGPLDGTHWIFNHDRDVPTMDPDVVWRRRPEPVTWPLPDLILAPGDTSGVYVKDSESQVPERLSHVVRGAFYVWQEGRPS